MYTPPELSTSKSEFKTSNVQSNYLPPTNNYLDYAENGNYQGLNIYNNYNPNFHHHHYYYPNFDSYQNSMEHNWIRKYDYENQKEYFTANTPSPAEFCDFEIPQANNFVKTNKSNEIEKYFYDTPKASPVIVNKETVPVSQSFIEQNKSNGSEKFQNLVQITKSEVKINHKNSKRCKSPSSSSDLGNLKNYNFFNVLPKI